MKQGTETAEESNDGSDTTPATYRPLWMFCGFMACLFVVEVGLVAPAVQYVQLPDTFLQKIAGFVAFIVAFFAAVAYVIGSALIYMDRHDCTRLGSVVGNYIHASLPFLFVGACAVHAATADTLYSHPPSDPIWDIWIAAAALLAVPGAVIGTWVLTVSDTDMQAMRTRWNDRRLERSSTHK